MIVRVAVSPDEDKTALKSSSFNGILTGILSLAVLNLRRRSSMLIEFNESSDVPFILKVSECLL